MGGKKDILPKYKQAYTTLGLKKFKTDIKTLEKLHDNETNVIKTHKFQCWHQQWNQKHQSWYGWIFPV